MKKTSIAISVIGHVIMGFKLKILGLCISEVRLGRPPIKMGINGECMNKNMFFSSLVNEHTALN